MKDITRAHCHHQESKGEGALLFLHHHQGERAHVVVSSLERVIVRARHCHQEGTGTSSSGRE